MTISATIIGRLGQEPETRQTSGGHSVTEFRVATKHGFGDREVSTWLSVSMWGKRGETAARFHHKGDQVVFIGCSVYNEEYQGKMYLKAEAKDFVFVSKPKEDRQPSYSGPRPGEPTPHTTRRNEQMRENLEGEDLPF